MSMFESEVDASVGDMSSMGDYEARMREQDRQAEHHVSDSSDEDDMHGHPFPRCVDNIDPELQRLLKVQFRGFRKHMSRAIERNQLEDLFALKSLFQTQVVGPFLMDLPFKRIIKPKKVVDEWEKETVVVVKPNAAWVDQYLIPCRIAEKLVKTTLFETVMIVAILTAGVTVGISTYLDCGPSQSCRGIMAEDRRACSNPAQLAANWTSPPTQVQCASAGCCFDETVVVESSLEWPMGFPNGTGVACFTKGPMPECWHGSSADTLREWMGGVEYIVLIIFTAEVVFKILAEKLKPWKYFYDGQNVFDFFIVVACYLPGGEDVAVLRLMRLARLLKVLHFVHQLQIILKGLANGMASIQYILVLMFLIFYLFAIVSVIMFGDNDPLHFGTLHIAMVSLFRMSTMEDWTDIMYINMWGCLQYGYVGGSYCYNLDNCDHVCDKGFSKGYGWAALFFIVFEVISGLVVMSLFIGVITTSMVEASEEAKETRKSEQMRANRQQVLQAIQGGEGAVAMTARTDMDDEEIAEAPPEDGATGALGVYLSLGRKVHAIISPKWFQNFIIGCILMAAVLIGMQTYDTLERELSGFFFLADSLILAVFTFECLAKMVACGRTPHHYFYNGWNVSIPNLVSAVV